MAKHTNYRTNRKSSNSRIIGLVILLILALLVIWQLNSSNPAQKLFKAGVTSYESKDYITARQKLNEAINLGLNQDRQLKAKQILTAIADSQNQTQLTKEKIDRSIKSQTQSNKTLTNTPPPPATTPENQKITPPPQKNAPDPQKTIVQSNKNTLPPPAAKQIIPGNEPAEKLFASGINAYDAKDYLKARDYLSDAVLMGLRPQLDQQGRKLLNEISDHWLFSRNIFSGDEYCSRHKVLSGELLANLQQIYTVPYALIMRINNIKDPRYLSAGQTIKVVRGPFHAVVERSKFRMSVFVGDVLVRTYSISLGMPGRETPTGLWRVMVKQPNPGWNDPETGIKYLPNDPANPLGERWIGLEGLEGDAEGRTGFGIHGTIEPNDIGKATSRGCIRLYNGDVRELYDMLITNKSRVRVVQ